VGFIARDGNILCSFTHFEKESIPKAGGSAVIIEKCEEQKLVEYTRLIVKKLAYSGWGLAEYKYCDKRHDFVMMEINSKFWASCEFAFRNNPLFMKYLFGIDSKNENIHGMLYVDRAIERGFMFCLMNIKYFIAYKKIFNFVSWKQVLRMFLPKWLLRFYRRHKQ